MLDFRARGAVTSPASRDDLRQEVAAEVTRRRVPELVFRIEREVD